MPPTKITKGTFQAALPGTYGIISRIARNIGVSPQAVWAWSNRKQNKEWAYAMMEQEKLTMVSLAENELLEILMLGKTKGNEGMLKDSKFLSLKLKASENIINKLGKVFGYVERKEIVNSGSQEFRISKEEAEEWAEKIIKPKDEK
jgi:hypothetical protein